MKWEAYLQTRYRTSTAKRYQREIELLGQSLDPMTASRKQLLAYLDGMRQQKRSGGSLRTTLAAFKAWYRYLNQTDQRADHPCRFVRLRDVQTRDVQLQDLFSREELETLLERKERYPLLRRRNQLIISLLIYQGLSRQELTQLRLSDLDLQAGIIHVPATSRTNSRKLALKSKQILLSYQYICEDRPKLLQGRSSESLLITKSGTDENGEGITYLLETKRDLFPRRKLSATTVRMSVVTAWLREGMDLRKAQHQAGHKYPSSTERYRQSNLEKLKDAVDKFHPLS